MSGDDITRLYDKMDTMHKDLSKMMTNVLVCQENHEGRLATTEAKVKTHLEEHKDISKEWRNRIWTVVGSVVGGLTLLSIAVYFGLK